MSRLSEFFEGADTHFGVFYPNHCPLAVFSNLTKAEGAERPLNRSGRLARDVISASGDAVVRFAKDRLVNEGIWGALMTELSRKIGTEAEYTDEDLVAAKAGAAFVAVRCATAEAKDAAWRVLETAHPLTACFYSAGGIERL
jgi:hypothetical protein